MYSKFRVTQSDTMSNNNVNTFIVVIRNVGDDWWKMCIDHSPQINSDTNRKLLSEKQPFGIRKT